MELAYPVNCLGHDVWLNSGYDRALAHGDVVTRDGQFLGIWRVVGYDPENEHSRGHFEFVPDGEQVVKFTEDFAMLDVRTSRGLALSRFTRNIRKWHEAQ